MSNWETSTVIIDMTISALLIFSTWEYSSLFIMPQPIEIEIFVVLKIVFRKQQILKINCGLTSVIFEREERAWRLIVHIKVDWLEWLSYQTHKQTKAKKWVALLQRNLKFIVAQSVTRISVGWIFWSPMKESALVINHSAAQSVTRNSTRPGI